MYVFNVLTFFSKSKKHYFFRFFELLHTFSRTLGERRTPPSSSSGYVCLAAPLITRPCGDQSYVELHHCAKLHRSWSIHSEDITIFRFFKMVATAIVDFRNSQILLAGGFRRAKMHHHAKFRWYRLIHCGCRPSDFPIFQDGSWQHLGFVKLSIFSGRCTLEGRVASLC